MKEVYQLSDLSDRETLDAGAEKPARLAVIGYPVKHSASPQMHQAALDDQDIDARYIRIEVEPNKVGEAINKMRKLDFIGCNVTVPHKTEALECCDSLSTDAETLGVVNTLIFGEQVIGHNSDAPGFVKAIREEFGIDLSDLKVMILGAGGGAGRAIATQCVRSGCEPLWLVNRSIEKIESLAKELSKLPHAIGKLEGPGDKIECLRTDSEEFQEIAGHAELIINATSLGLKPFDPLPIPEGSIEPHHLVYDMIYNPNETALLTHAKEQGARTANGISMLLHQGAISFKCWFPEALDPIPAMRKGLK